MFALMLVAAGSLNPILPWLSGVFGLLCLWAAFRAGRRQRLIEDIPTSRTGGVFIGCVELQGTAEAEQPLTSYLGGQKCVFYEWQVEEHWSRTVTETYQDDKGETRTRTRQESGWKTVSHGEQMTPFYLKDDEGVIRILPDKAKIEPQTIFSKTCGRSDPLYYGKGPSNAISDSDHRRRFRETSVPLHHSVYIIGQARERDDVVAPEIAADETAPLFLISTRDEEQVRSGYQWAFWGWFVFGAFLAGGGGFIASGGAVVHGIIPFLPGLLYFTAAVLGWIWMVYNSLVELRQRVRQGWSQVDVQLQRRSDLIPNLVRIVGGLRNHEKSVQEEMADLRSQLHATAPGQPGPEYHACAKDLVAIAERYPELKSDKAFVNLQDHLVDTEHRIALARAYFNDIATFYNIRLERVPDRFVARLASMQPRALLSAKDFEREPVVVNLAE